MTIFFFNYIKLLFMSTCSVNYKGHGWVGKIEKAQRKWVLFEQIWLWVD